MVRPIATSLLLVFVGFASNAQLLDVDDEFTLSNGLKIVTMENHTVPSICFSIAFHAGSRNERLGITGISHLLEHMMFNGSENYKPMEFDKILEAGGGYSNAYTSRDITFYYEEFNPDLLDKVLDMEADRLSWLKIDTANLEQERGIVKEERRVSTDNSVSSKMFEDLYAAAYVVHPYHNPVIGWMTDLDNITLQDAKDYFKAYYAPSNATVFVVGDFDSKALRAKMEKFFGSVLSQSRPVAINNAESQQQGERRLKLHKVAELPAVAIGYKTVGVSSPDIYPLNLLATVLSRGQSSRLYKRLVYELELVTEISAWVDEYIDPGLFSFYAQMQPGKAAADAEEEIYEFINAIAETGVTEDELHKAINMVQMDYIKDFTTNVGIANRLAYYEVVHGDYRKSAEGLDRYARVTSEDLRRVARRYFSERARTVVVLVPESSTRSDLGTLSN
jgi:predicted Zn-dependent peptidase